jgi:hypothetical protein
MTTSRRNGIQLLASNWRTDICNDHCKNGHLARRNQTITMLRKCHCKSVKHGHERMESFAGTPNQMRPCLLVRAPRSAPPPKPSNPVSPSMTHKSSLVDLTQHGQMIVNGFLLEEPCATKLASTQRWPSHPLRQNSVPWQMLARPHHAFARCLMK